MRNVVVTGGSCGLSLEIARKLAASGFQVIAVARKENERLAGVIAEAQGLLHFRPADLAEIESLPGLVKALQGNLNSSCGPVNNAGLGIAGILANTRDTDIEQVVRLNVVMPLTLTKRVVRSMHTQASGRIVNISSVVSLTGYSGLSVYSTKKASNSGFTRSLAREVGLLGITVNAVALGFIDTEMTNALSPDERAKIQRRSAPQRMAEVEDVAS